MAVITRILAAATLASIAFADIAGASAADTYALAAHRARAHSHHERAPHVNGVKRSEHPKKRSAEKRCKAATTSLASTTTQAPTTTTHKTTSTKHTTSTKAAETTAVSSGGGKKFLAWGGDNAQLKLFEGQGIVGIYNWGPSPPSASGMYGISQLWGTKSLTTFRQERTKYTHLMGMNECNLASQSYMSASAAAAMWKAEILPYKSGRTLIAPSVTTASSGIPWLQDFYDALGGVAASGAQVNQAHVYAKTADSVISYATTMHTTFGLPVFISEFACQSFVAVAGGEDCDAAEAEAFIKGVTAFCESTSWIWGCAPFGAMEDTGNVNPVNAFISGNSLTSIGKLWLSS